MVLKMAATNEDVSNAILYVPALHSVHTFVTVGRRLSRRAHKIRFYSNLRYQLQEYAASLLYGSVEASLERAEEIFSRTTDDLASY